MQRAIIKDMLKTWDKTHPGRLESMFSALSNTCPSQLLDRNLFDFDFASPNNPPT
jgi:tRNA 2-thiocytidine biosynthesis protein TtcA